MREKSVDGKKRFTFSGLDFLLYRIYVLEKERVNILSNPTSYQFREKENFIRKVVVCTLGLIFAF